MENTVADEKKDVQHDEQSEFALIPSKIDFSKVEELDLQLLEKIETPSAESGAVEQSSDTDEDTPIENTAEPIDGEVDTEQYLDVEHFSDLFTDDKNEEDENVCFTEETLIVESENPPHHCEENQNDSDYENLTILQNEDEPAAPIKKSKIEDPDAAPYVADKPRKVDARFELIELFVFTLVAIILITTFFFKHSVVDGSSMESTLYGSDHLIISDFLYEPKQYDIVVIDDKTSHDAPMVKRVIATEGQTVRLVKRMIPELSFKDDYYYVVDVYVDGEPIRDDIAHYSGSDNVIIDCINEDHVLVEYGENEEYFIFEYTVPENEIYVLGDHRNMSKDSRMFGSVKVDTILGKVLFRIFPFDQFGSVD